MASTTDPSENQRPHEGACTCPACAPTLWAAGIKGAKSLPSSNPRTLEDAARTSEFWKAEKLAADREIERAQRIMRRAISWLQIKEAASTTRKGPAIIEEMQRFVAGSSDETESTLRKYVHQQLGFLTDDDNRPAESLIRLAVKRLEGTETRKRCLIAGCQKPPLPDAALCFEHNEKVNEQQT